MNGLSLCAGVGGLDLGIEIAFPQFRTVAAVESNAEAARRFRLRFPAAKIFPDVLGFDGRSWRSRVDCVLAGWPCQPHSVAGQRRGVTDERWIWDDIARIVRECEAPLFFGENVSGILRDADSDIERTLYVDDAADDAIGGMGTVLRDLAALGFYAEWGCFRASGVGAAHGRPRVFVLACRADLAGSRRFEPADVSMRSDGPVDDAEYAEWWQENLARDGAGEGGDAEGQAAGSARSAGGILADAEHERRSLRGAAHDHDGRDASGDHVDGCDRHLFAPGPSDAGWPSILGESPLLAPALSPVEVFLALALQPGALDVSQETEPQLRRLAAGVAAWLHERRIRLQADGNLVVPLQAAACFAELARRLKLV